MAVKMKKPTFDEALNALRRHGFEVTPFAGVTGGMLASKHGVGAVLKPGPGKSNPVACAESPGVLVRGQIARLLDRGHQKFIKTPQYELPATADHLHAIHEFSEELKQRTGLESLYNESLGTTSDIYLYDRLKGREAEPAHGPLRPWELTEGH